MYSVNVNALVPMADSRVSSVAMQYGASDTSTGLAAEIANQMAEFRKAALEDAAIEVINLMADYDEFLRNKAGVLASLEYQMAATKALMASVQLASQFGAASDNYLPLASQLGYNIPEANRDMARVPKDFPPATLAAVATAA